MTQALMDLGPQLDLKPGGPGESRGTADSGAAFAEAVDQAVSRTRDRTDALRHEDPDADRPSDPVGDDRDPADEARGSDRAADAAAATVAWALTPTDLRTAHDARRDSTVHPRHGDARHGEHEPVGVVTGASLAAHRHAAVAAPDDSGAEPDGPALGNAREKTGAGSFAVAAAPSSGRAIATDGSMPERASSSSPRVGAQTDAAEDPADDTVRTPRHAEHPGRALGLLRTTPPAAEARNEAPAAPGIVPRHRAGTATDTSAPTAPVADASPAPGARMFPGSPAPAAVDAEPTGLVESLARHQGPDEATGIRFAAAGPPPRHAASGASGGSTSVAMNQMSPATVHVPTAVGTTANSTPVAATTPMPTPFTQAQPDVANILAQLRGRSDGTYQLRAQVHPAELGAVAITATVHHGALTLTLTPDQAAQQAISQSLPQLRQHLADQGFTGVNVGLGSPDQSGQHGQGGGDREYRAQGSDHSSLHGPDVAIGAADHASARRAAGTQSALDLML